VIGNGINGSQKPRRFVLSVKRLIGIGHVKTKLNQKVVDMKKKKSFVLYCDQYEPVKNLTVEQKGLLLDAIFLYHCDKSHKISDPIVDMAFLFFKQTFDRDCIKYSAKCKKNKENAMKRWHANASK